MKSFIRPTLFFLLICLLSGITIFAEEANYFYPEVEYDASTPTLAEVVGHSWGEEVTSYAEMESYLQSLAEASPHVHLASYGATWEGRDLYYLIIGSTESLADLAGMQARYQTLAYPDRESSEAVLESLPSLAWLAYGVHGNEISSTDAALLTAYFLAAAQDSDLRNLILENSLVIIDPLQNPDGRQRFVSYFRETRGRWPDPDPQAAEHNEDWPGGRTNHYFFDMNRDWFAMTQPETVGRVELYLKWFPQVFVDLHEMGGDSTYYFAPPADPVNPILTPAQEVWLERFGRNNARWFDERRFDYFTREIFDSFYPGYGEGWPMFHGSIGMTYEQASVRGLVRNRDDGTTLHYRDSVLHHFIASLATLETTAENRLELLRYFADFRRSAADRVTSAETPDFVIPAETNRATKLVSLLLEQGISVERAEEPFSITAGESNFGVSATNRTFPAGTFLVSTGQAGSRLAQVLLQKHVAMAEGFIEEQRRRLKKGLRDQIYDVTAWSLPFIYNVTCWSVPASPEVQTSSLTESPAVAGDVVGDQAQVAYLVPWGSKEAIRLLAALHRQGVRVFATDEAFAIDGRDFARGSLIVKVKNNPSDLHNRLEDLAATFQVRLFAVDSAWVESGVNFGSNLVRFLERPHMAMVYNLPTRSYSTGAIRYLVEQDFGYPVTLLHALDLGSSDLSKYDVLILPDAYGARGGYSGVFGDRGVERLKSWVREGGTLVAVGEASRWLVEENVALLSTQLEKAEEKTDDAEEESNTLDDLIQPDEDSPPFTPGAILLSLVDSEHWLGFGYGERVPVLVQSQRIFSPLKLNEGTNVVTFAGEEELVLGGLVWNEARAQLPHKAFLMHQTRGRGHVIAFAEDPAFRGYLDGLHGFLANALFFGVAH